MSEPLILYRFRYCDELAGKVRETSYRLTDEQAREQFRDRLVERLEHTREVRYPQEHRGHYPRG